MKKSVFIVILVSFFLLFSGRTTAQSYVTNGDFEALDSCPYQLFQVEFCKNWFPARNTPDFFHCGLHTVNNFNFPNTGSGFMGMLGGLLADTASYYYGELIKTKLQSPLIAGKRYLVKFSVGLDVFTTTHDQNDFGIYFFNSNHPLNFDFYSKDCLLEKPQISINSGSLLQGDYVDFSFCFIPEENFDSILVGPWCNNKTLSGPLHVVYYSIDDFSITEFQTTNFVGSPVLMCDSGNVTFNPTNWTQPTNVQWQFDGGNPNTSNFLYPLPVIYNQPGSYDVTFILDDVCNDTIVKPDYITVLGSLSDVLPDAKVTKCSEVSLQLSTSDQISGRWSTGVFGSSIQVTDPGIYYFTQENVCDTLVDSVEVVNEVCACGLYIPNAFTPNGDGKNDFFKVYGDGENLVMNIYNRWGEVVFSTRDKFFSWDGKFEDENSKLDVFYYKASFTDCQQRRKQVTGRVTVLY